MFIAKDIGSVLGTVNSRILMKFLPSLITIRSQRYIHVDKKPGEIEVGEDSTAHFVP